ncbi:MAG: hypothetical protein LiPW15_676 [Parcubacteria group bacterium LiPW_15]|nr:MAG: hypothetical protein LiPW15_676 [Parcubacteria group bacterium LiPW_15]
MEKVAIVTTVTGMTLEIALEKAREKTTEEYPQKVLEERGKRDKDLVCHDETYDCGVTVTVTRHISFLTAEEACRGPVPAEFGPD